MVNDSASAGEAGDRASAQTHSSLGAALESYFRLSESDKALFISVVQATAQGVNLGAGSSTGGDSNTVSTSVIGNNPKFADGSRKKLPRGEQPPQGFTKNPKTGEVFKKNSSKARSEEFLGLEGSLAAAKRELWNYRQSANLTVGDDNNVEESTLPLPQAQQEYGRLWAIMSLAKDNIATYKRLHPEEFRPPKGYVPEKGQKDKAKEMPCPVDPAKDPRYIIPKGKMPSKEGDKFVREDVFSSRKGKNTEK
jgi:hypothetical protein